MVPSLLFKYDLFFHLAQFGNKNIKVICEQSDVIEDQGLFLPGIASGNIYVIEAVQSYRTSIIP